jgi:hypothetical protein
MHIRDDFLLGSELLQCTRKLDDLVAIGSSHALVDVIQQWLFDRATANGSRIDQVVGVDDAYNVLEFLHPRLRRKWCPIPVPINRRSAGAKDMLMSRVLTDARVPRAHRRRPRRQGSGRRHRPWGRCCGIHRDKHLNRIGCLISWRLWVDALP